MGPGIPLVMAALGLIAFATSTKSAKAAPAGGPVGPSRPEFQNIPLPLLQEMAKVVQELTVTDFATGSDGSVTSATILGPITKESVQKATNLAAKLEQAGFTAAAKTISDLAKMASAKLPSPPAVNQIPLPAQCFTTAESENLNRLVAVERDPKKLQAVLDALKARQVPAECAAQVKVFVDMLSALIIQSQAKIDDETAILKTEEILKTGAPSTPTKSTPLPAGALPRVVVVQSGDGFARITKRLLGSDTRWRELRDRNVPRDADGRTRAKDTDAKGGMKPALNPGNKLFVPESWPAMDSVTVVPTGSPPPFVPSIPTQVPGQVPGVTPKVTIVKSGDGFSMIAKRLIGDASRWPELRDRNVPMDADGRKRAVDTAAKGGIKPILQPNQKLFVPESWNVAPGIVVSPSAAPSLNPVSLPTQLPPPPQLPAQLPQSVGIRTVTVKSGDGFFRIAQRLGVDGNRWRELRDRNVPVDGDSRSRAKDTDAKGGIKPQLNPGNRLIVPESWPAIPAGVSGFEDDIEVGLSGGQQLLVKTPQELTAEQMCSHLNRLLNKHPNLEKVRAKCDKRIIARFQKLCGLPMTATVTPSTLLKAAESGQTNIPFVLHWPQESTAQHVSGYRMVLAKMAAEAKERGDHQGARELAESAKRERGQAAGLNVD